MHKDRTSNPDGRTNLPNCLACPYVHLLLTRRTGYAEQEELGQELVKGTRTLPGSAALSRAKDGAVSMTKLRAHCSTGTTIASFKSTSGFVQTRTHPGRPG